MFSINAFFFYFPPALIGSVDADGPLSVLTTFQYAHLQFQVRFLSFTKKRLGTALPAMVSVHLQGPSPGAWRSEYVK